jgi:dienelactone hydrolase
MQIVAESTVDGITERLFALDVAGEHVPGVLWTPENVSTPRPLVLMGHGGSQHKRVTTLVTRARGYAAELGFAVAAIDAPGHGERVSLEDSARFAAEIGARIAAGEKVGGELATDMAKRAAQGVPEWRATLDALQRLPEIGDSGPVGYWGVSMGTAIGVPLVAADSRITAAVLGLAGVIEGNGILSDLAREITVPVEFVMQWDDELIHRDSALALFDAIGSAEKSLHLNPGGHLGIPSFELDSWKRFFVRHLVG